MKKFLFLFLFAASPALAAEPNLCADPIKAVCGQKYEAPAASEAAIRERAKAIAMERLGPAKFEALRKAEDPTAPRTAADYILAQNAVYDAVLEKLKPLGLSEEGLTDHLLKIRGVISARLRAGLGPEDGPSAAKGYTNENLARAVDKIVFLGPRRLEVGGKNPELARMDLDSYFAHCGGDGMTRNAFYAEGAFTLCPGMLLWVLETGNVHALDFIAAHEMGHAVDSQAAPPAGRPQTEPYPLWERYGGMMACVEKNYREDLVDISTARTELTNRVIKPARAKIAELSQAEIPDEEAILNQKRKLNAFTSMVDGMAFEEKAIRTKVGRVPHVSETHSAEMCADHYGTASLANALGNAEPGERASLVKATFRWLCKRPSESFVDLKYEIVKGDGSHPPPEWRMYEALQNPSLRLTLGCASVAGDRPWCGPSGRKSLALACDPPEPAAASASACEDLLRKRLGGSCALSYLACAPLRLKRQACEVESTNCSLPTATGDGKRTCGEGGQKAAMLLGKPVGYVCRGAGEAGGVPAASGAPGAQDAK